MEGSSRLESVIYFEILFPAPPPSPPTPPHTREEAMGSGYLGRLAFTGGSRRLCRGARGGLSGTEWSPGRDFGDGVAADPGPRGRDLPRTREPAVAEFRHYPIQRPWVAFGIILAKAHFPVDKCFM